MFCKIVIPSGDIHKLASVPKTLEELQEISIKKFKSKLPPHYTFKYKDSDDELIALINDEDYDTAILTSEQEKIKTLRVYIVKDDSNLAPESEKKQNDQQNPTVKINAPVQFGANQNDKKNDFGNIDLTSSFYGTGERVGSDPSHLNPNQGNISNANNNQIQGGDGHHEAALDEDEEFEKLANSLPGGLDSMKKSLSQPPKSLMRKGSLLIDAGMYFSDEQLRVLEDLIDRKVREKMEQYSKDGTFDDPPIEFKGRSSHKRLTTGNSSFTGSKLFHQSQQAKQNTLMNKSIRKSTQAQTQDFKCNKCGQKIEGIRYSCTVCKDFDYCTVCEEADDHAHPFIKLRPNKSQNKKDPSPTNPLMIENKAQTQSIISEGVEDIDYKHVHRKSITGSSHSLLKSKTSPLTHNKSANDGTVKKHVPTEIKKYHCRVVKEPDYHLYRVKAGSSYNIIYTIRNSGEDHWPPGVKLICTSGVHKGLSEDMPPLEKGKDFIVNLPLIAPEKLGADSSQWKLHFPDDNGKMKPFGTQFNFEIEVLENKHSEPKQSEQNKKKQAQESSSNSKETATGNLDLSSNDEDADFKRALALSEKESTESTPLGYLSTSSLGEEDVKLMREMKCTKPILEKAKILNDLFEGDGLREKVQFVNSCGLSLTIDDIVEKYMDYMSRPKQAKGVGLEKEGNQAQIY